MNVKNNKRRQDTVEKIEKTFMNMLQKKEISQITVSDICSSAQINRSTFYANYADIYDLADKIRESLEREFNGLFQGGAYSEEENGAFKMFTHIKENQLFYKTYFKLGYDRRQNILVYDIKRAEQDFNNKNIKYHIEFFKSGINAIIKMWLEGGCAESPEEMAEIIKEEYRGR